MELCLGQLKRWVKMKEVRSAQCFSKLTMVLSRLTKVVSDNSDIYNLYIKLYELVGQHDKLTQSIAQLELMIEDKSNALLALQEEYNALANNQMDKKIALGEKIRSAKLELDKGLKDKMDAMINRRQEIVQQCGDLQDDLDELLSKLQERYQISEDDKTRIRDEFNDGKRDNLKGNVQKAVAEMRKKHGLPESQQGLTQDATNAEQTPIQEPSSDEPQGEEEDAFQRLIHKYVHQSERWRNFSFAVGFELNQLKKMLPMCEDATIKVRRLVHNFEERMKDTQDDVWDKHCQMKQDFDLKNISLAGLQDIILLHDWWAANAPGATAEQMGMSDQEFADFRRRCNKISYNLRKNQCRQLLAVKLDNIQRRILEIQDILQNKDTLKWRDKYGWEAKNEEQTKKEWSVSDADPKLVAKARLELLAEGIVEKGRYVATQSELSSNMLEAKTIVGSDAILKREAEAESVRKVDAKLLVKRTMSYLKQIGLIDGEDDFEKIALRNVASLANPELTMKCLRVVEQSKSHLDSATNTLIQQRDNMKSIIESVDKMERKVAELKDQNKRICAQCARVGKNASSAVRAARDKMLLQKVENESKIMDLNILVKKTRKKHLQDFSALERMRGEVDEAQLEHDKQVEDFKRKIGLNEESIQRLMMGIYNKYQDEILEHDNKRSKK